MSARNDYGTGEPAFEDFLAELDQQLLGARRVRELSVAEVADHLLEHRDDAMERGHPREAAVESALEGFGSGPDYAEFQRAALTQRFARLAIVTGAAFAVLSCGLQWAGPGAVKVWSSALQGLLFGPGLAAWLVFVQPSRRLSFAPEVGEEFTVGFGPWMRGLTVLMLLVFSAIGLGGLAVGLGFQWEDVSPAHGLVLGAGSLLVLAMCWGQLTRLHVTPRGIRAAWLGRGTFFSWEQIQQLRPRTERWVWMPRLYWGRVLDVEVLDSDGTLRHFPVFPDAVNASRLTYMVSRHLDQA